MQKFMIGEKGYPLMFFYASKPWKKSFWIASLMLLAGLVFFVLFSRFSDDWSGDSFAGYTFALLGTFFMVLAAVDFFRKRRARKRAIGQLNAALNWHVAFGIIAFAFLCFHSFGHLNPRTGTYALYGMIALVISGFVGRALDRIVPRLIAIEASKALTTRGEDRIESISRRIEAIVVHNKQEVHGFQAPSEASLAGIPRMPSSNGSYIRQKLSNASDERGEQGNALPTPWDIAYISLDETPQELSREPQYRLVPDKKSTFAKPEALLPGAEEQMSEMDTAKKALRREQFYRYMIRYWRMFHITLAVVTVGLTLWHIEYALALLIPALPALLGR